MNAIIELSELRKQLLDTIENVIVLGGPGSGKTTMALLKADQEIQFGNLKLGQRILFLSFARATIARVAQHAGKLLSAKNFESLEINTYHGFAWNILRSHGYLIRDGRCVNLLPPPEAAARLSAFKTDCERGIEKHRLFMEEGLLHFDLFAEMAAKLLMRSNALSRIICDAYPLVVLDEFQDTNKEEWELIRCLGRGGRIIALADAEQRIYEFRGADPKRIGEFVSDFQPKAFDFGLENYRSNGTDISEFGNDLLAGVNRGKEYKNVKIKFYGFYAGRNQFFSLKIGIINSMRRLIKEGECGWSVAVLVPTKRLMLQVSDYLSADVDGLPSLKHDVALDAEGPSLAAVLIASLLEGGVNIEIVSRRLINNFCLYIRGRKGSKLPNKDEFDLVEALDEYLILGKIKGPKKKRIVEALSVVAKGCLNLKLSGDPGADWLIIGDLLELSDIEVIQQIALDAKYLRLLQKGATLRSRLSDLWRSTGTY